MFDGDHWLTSDLTRLRREQIGFIFQSPYLLPFLNVHDNVALLAMLLGHPNWEARAAADQLLADEPTAPLDSARALAVMDLLERLAGQIGTSVIVVTHDEKIMPRLRRIYVVRDGVVHHS